MKYSIKHLIAFAVMIGYLSVPISYAKQQHAHDQAQETDASLHQGEEITVEPNQAMIKVKGIVCSFCAFGAEKKLSKLTFLDHSQFGKDGVSVDIHAGLITLALALGKPIDLNGIDQAIKKGGYDPVAIYLRLTGSVEKKEDRYFLTHTTSGQLFELVGDGLGKLVGTEPADIQGHLDTAQIPFFNKNEPYRVIVDKKEAGL